MYSHGEFITHREKDPHDMTVIDRVFESVFGRGSDGYRCAFCSQSFEREPPNCPACGCSEIR